MQEHKKYLLSSTIKIRKTAAVFLLTAVCLFLSGFAAMNMTAGRQIHERPGYEKVDIKPVLKKESFSQKDYNTLYMQTGLGKPAVDDIKKDCEGNEAGAAAAFESYQRAFFSKDACESDKIGIITYEERGPRFRLAPVRNGDILISASTHTSGWRHGHAALVIDAEQGLVLEATLWGHPVSIKDIGLWNDYATFLLLRPKKGIDGDKIAEYAKEHLDGVPYGLLSGIPSKSPDSVKKTQCAHLVWYAYHQLGYDIDSNGGWLVTPKDLAGSNFLEVVQVYGMNPKELWK